MDGLHFQQLALTSLSPLWIVTMGDARQSHLTVVTLRLSCHGHSSFRPCLDSAFLTYPRLARLGNVFHWSGRSIAESTPLNAIYNASPVTMGG